MKPRHQFVIGSIALCLTAFTAQASDTLTERLHILFNGSVSGSVYTLGSGETDTTGTFKANGSPTITAGAAALDGSAATDANADGFSFNPSSLGSLTGQNWVAESIVSFDAFGGGQRTIIDVLGDTDFRINNAGTSLQAGYWDGSTFGSVSPALPALATPVHLALVWDAAATSLTAYVDGVSVGTVNNNAFATPDTTNVSFGYLGRSGLVGRGIDGSLDSVSFSTFTGAFAPANDFRLFTPPVFTYRYWDIDGATAGAGGGNPGGNWNDSKWSASATGESATAAWTAGADAVFAAGTDATGGYTVDLGATAQSVGSVWVEEGDVTLSNGTLNLAAGGMLKSTGTYLEVAAALNASDFKTTGNILLSGTTTVTGSLDIQGSTLTLGAPLIVGGLLGSGNLDLTDHTLTAGGATETTYSGLISGNGALIKHGAGKLKLGNISNSFIGNVSVTNGILETGTSAGGGTVSYLGAVDGSRSVTINSGATLRYAQANVFGGGGKTATTIPSIIVDGGTVTTVRYNTIGNVTLKNAGSLTNSSTETDALYGGFQLLGSVNVDGSGTGTFLQNSASTRPVHLLGVATTTFNVDDITASTAADLTVSSPLANGSGDYPGVAALTKSGAGAMTLSGANTYTGDTTVTGGVLAVSGNSIADTGKLVIDGGKVAPTGTETVDTLFFGTTQQASGTWGAAGSGATHIDDSRLSGTSGVVNVTTGPSNTYTSWIGGFPGAAGAPGFTQDADNDGITNGVEHILGTNPSASSSGLVPISATANSVTFQHSQTNDLATNVVKSYEWSADLTEWKASGVANTGGTIGTIVPTTFTDNSSPAKDVIHVVVTATGTATAKLFVRLVADGN